MDRFDRCISYLRVSVTDRCDHRCVYCMPPAGPCLKPRGEILSYEQICTVAKAAVDLGIRKVRLTGGEPLLRRNIETLVDRLSGIPGLDELCMTTNGTRLRRMAVTLKEHGLDRVNVSMDTLDPEKYRRITRGGDVAEVLDGMDAARAAGLTPVKVNMVIFPDTTDAEVDAMRAFCATKGHTLQKIMLFSLYDRKDLSGRFHAERPPKCEECNRLRLTSDGFLKPCLFSEDEIRVDFEDPRGSIERAVQAKPESGSCCRNRGMSAIGG